MADTDPALGARPLDRWLVVVAHPDDETFGCGSLIAAAARGGAAVTVACFTRGEAGERTPDIDDAADLGEIRTGELRAAARALGAADVVVLDYLDSGFDGDPPAGSLCAAPLADVVRDVEHLVAGHDPQAVVIVDASDGHRDHARIKEAVRHVRADHPHVQLFQVALPRSLMRRWLDEARATHPDAAYLDLDPETLGTPDDLITDVLDHGDVLGVREEAIALHRSQRSPYEDLSPGLRRDFLAVTYVIR